MRISGKMEGIYSKRRLMGEGNKPKECERSSRRIQEGIWKSRKKNGRRRNAGKIYGKNAIWMG